MLLLSLNVLSYLFSASLPEDFQPLLSIPIPARAFLLIFKACPPPPHFLSDRPSSGHPDIFPSTVLLVHALTSWLSAFSAL